jgi:hypothetical protein
MTDEERSRALGRLLIVLRPYLPNLVLIGGWVPELYRLHGGFAEWRTRLSGTVELDLLVTEIDDAATRPPLATVLETAGLHPEENALGAIWAGPPESGERIEFFVPHRGVARTLGRPRRIAKQERIAAIQLSDLELLASHTRTLTVPMAADDRTPAPLGVVVPTLGAYLVTKAATDLKRSSATEMHSRSKRAKDLVYVRDVMAAGAEVVAQVENDITAIAATGKSRPSLRTAINNLTLLDLQSPILLEAATEVAARDRIAEGQAIRDLMGHIIDLREILRQHDQTH